MSAIKLTADSGGGTVELKAPATTTGNAALQFKLPVADGTSGQALTTNASGQLAFSTISGGISELDCYRISSTFQGNAYHITSNWERFDASGEGKKGTGVSESGGVFTFPSTGYYYIEWSPTFYRGANSTFYGQFSHIRGASSFYSESGNSGTGAHTSTIFKCENTSTHKVLFGVEVEQYVYTYGSTANNQSHAIFIKLADI